eukprot:215682-Chlamydomonas_euryale.AAC.1
MAGPYNMYTTRLLKHSSSGLAYPPLWKRENRMGVRAVGRHPLSQLNVQRVRTAGYGGLVWGHGDRGSRTVRPPRLSAGVARHGPTFPLMHPFSPRLSQCCLYQHHHRNKPQPLGVHTKEATHLAASAPAAAPPTATPAS